MRARSCRERLTLGVEEEFLLVDATGQLAAVGPAVSDGVADGPDGQTTPELRRCQVESATGVCQDVRDLLGTLARLRTRLADEAARHGLRLVPSGTAVLSEDRRPRLTGVSRYQRMAEQFGALADRTLTCACHVHVGLSDRGAGLVISNGIRPWLPVLLALAANSPFHDGSDTGYASWRRLVWNRWPSAGPPPHLTSVAAYESEVDGLLRSGAILDGGMVYWDIRLSDHQPTLEIRVADVAVDVAHAALVAVLVRALAEEALDNSVPVQGAGLSQEVLRARLWRSARDGLTGQCVDPRSGLPVPTWRLVEDLVARLGDRLRAAGDDVFVARTVARLRAEGGGAQRQRAAFARRRRLTDVVDALVWPKSGEAPGSS